MVFCFQGANFGAIPKNLQTSTEILHNMAEA